MWLIFNEAGDCVGGPSLREPAHHLMQVGWRSVAVSLDKVYLIVDGEPR
jgi:hypothetical protein